MPRARRPPEPDQGEAPDSTAAADVDGETVTVAEVDAWIKEQLFDQATDDRDPTKLYELRSRALDDMINERLLEQIAAPLGLTPDELIRQETEAQVDRRRRGAGRLLRGEQGAHGGSRLRRGDAQDPQASRAAAQRHRGARSTSRLSGRAPRSKSTSTPRESKWRRRAPRSDPTTLPSPSSSSATTAAASASERSR